MPKKHKQENEEVNGSTEPQNQEEEALDDSDIQEGISSIADSVLEDDFDGFEDEDQELVDLITRAAERAIPTREDFKNAKNTKTSVRADGMPYRPLDSEERDMLFAFYQKYNGNMSEMVLDKDCLFKAYSQIRFYAKLYHFKEQLIEIKRKRAEETIEKLKDAKTLAIENAIKLLESRHRLVFNRYGVQLFDTEGNPLIVEELPYYKSIKAAWEIIKTELGEATAIAKQDVTSGGKPIKGNVIVFESYKDEAKSQ